MESLLSREEERKLRIARLQQIKDADMPDGCPIETLISEGLFPESAIYPGWWSGGQTGAALAFALNPPCRVVFSHKLLTIRLEELDEEGRNMVKIRLDREKKRNARRAQDLRAKLEELQNEP